MSLRGAAFIAGAFEHPRRDIPDRTVAQVHAEVADGALRDAGLTLADVDAYYCAGDAPGFGGLSMAEYLGLRCRTFDSTETGGSSYLVHVGHAAAAIAAGHASVALITLAGTPRNGGAPPGGGAGVLGGARSRVREPVGLVRRRPTTPSPPAGTCTSSARRASSSPRSRSPPRCTPSTTRTPSCATS